MSLIAVLLILASAIMHAGWNLVGKREHPTMSFFLIGNSTAVLLLLPVLVYYRGRLPLIPLSVWIMLGVTGFFLALYYTALAGAYRSGEMSLAYPLARALSVIFVTTFMFILGKGGEIGDLGVFGMVLVVAGCLIVPRDRFREFRIKDYLNLCCLLALLAAIGTTGYTIMDDAALRRLRGLPNKQFSTIDATLLYVILEAASSCLWLAVGIIFSAYERKSFLKVLRSSKRKAGFVGLGIYLAYGLVLASMAYVSNVSYVAAFRQVSIPIGALLGIVLLKERSSTPKVLGIAVIFTGLVFVGLG